MPISLTVQDVIKIFEGLACFIFNLAYLACIIFIIIAGLRYMVAGGNSERISQAKRNFGWVLIGTIVIFAVTVIINTVAAAVGSGFSITPFC